MKHLRKFLENKSIPADIRNEIKSIESDMKMKNNLLKYYKSII